MIYKDEHVVVQFVDPHNAARSIVFSGVLRFDADNTDPIEEIARGSVLDCTLSVASATVTVKVER